MKLEEMGGLTPQQVRQVIRRGEYDGPTAGLCMGYAQCNLVVLPKEHAYDFLLFAQRNSRACPVLEVSEVGSHRMWISPGIFPGTGCIGMGNWPGNTPRWRNFGGMIW